MLPRLRASACCPSRHQPAQAPCRSASVLTSSTEKPLSPDRFLEPLPSASMCPGNPMAVSTPLSPPLQHNGAGGQSRIRARDCLSALLTHTASLEAVGESRGSEVVWVQLPSRPANVQIAHGFPSDISYPQAESRAEYAADCIKAVTGKPTAAQLRLASGRQQTLHWEDAVGPGPGRKPLGVLSRGLRGADTC